MAKKLIALFILLVSVTAGIVSLVFYYHSKNSFDEELRRRATILVKAVSKQATFASKRGNYVRGMEGVITSLKEDDDVSIAIVISNDGLILAHSEPGRRGGKFFVDKWVQEVLSSGKVSVRWDEGNRRYLAGISIQGPQSYKTGGRETLFPTGKSSLVIGAILIGLSSHRLDEIMKDIFTWAVISVLTLILLATVASIMFIGRIVKPLKALQAAAGKVAEGDLQTQVRAPAADEIGQLALSFNTMVKKLKSTTVSKNELGVLVKQRTNQLQEANESLQVINKKVKEMADMESKFVSFASHELRTPLSAIQGFNSMILKFYDRLGKEKILSYCKAVVDESNRLAKMINEILDLKRIQQGRIELDYKEVNLRSVAESVVAGLKMRPDQPRYEVSFMEGEFVALLDEDKVKQIFLNLLSNAAKYTPVEKSVTIEGLELPKSIVVHVRDQGPGIPREFLGKLFTPFSRSGDAISKKTVGTGLGLVISKALMERMGGKIMAENLDVGGAQFTVVFPKLDKPPEPEGEDISESLIS
ncbi:ATP-binding protein [Elusimicrobiota bacterium]